ncbi:MULTISPECIES: transglutaminase family protein [unclassified Streptomyces]|uniref:transglutaminase-like domain-containing protein n=1 Tax=unclassified Streptomyces TaxID=2593676 RepID=UPI00236720C6|nr:MULTISPECIES: transglutaminase family protein [unclassified Streptomyces]MDF3144906.1 transglutaminase family protein [Streptomyces sp. T21Q-yed]WDF35978.1 transglutaminase family protein [Streptomyces sp. T12]
MQMIQQTADLSAYLAADEVIDHHHPLVRETAAKLADDVADSYEYARAAFEFVRDTVPHSQDSGDLRVTWRASDVLEQGTGICYAKAHALTALLRAEDIPTALCYQKFEVVHGLVAVRFNGAWHRQDPRGNKPGVDAQFSLDGERLAFEPDPASDEMDCPVLYAAPHPVVLDTLKSALDRPHLWQTLPTAL